MPRLAPPPLQAVCRWMRICVVCGLVATALTGLEAQAQFSRSQNTAHRYAAGTTVNLYAHWQGEASADLLYVTLPPGWQLRRTTVLRRGYQPVSVEVRLEGTRYLLVPERPLNAPHTLVLTAETGTLTGTAPWSVVPATRGPSGIVQDPSRELRRPAALYAPQLDPVNQAARWTPDAGAPLLLRGAALPPLSSLSAHSVELWLKTAALNQVVLSTWDGDEESAYPLELVIDPAGRLRYYRGQPGTHQAMATPHPVADGRWHHVAIRHAPEAGWTHLLVDGFAVDSLYAPALFDTGSATAVALGGRRTGPVTFDGLMDEVRFWDHARPTTQLRQERRRPLASEAPSLVALSFDAPLPRTLQLGTEPASFERVATHLQLGQPPLQLEATTLGGRVQLQWTLEDAVEPVFFVERSVDGQVFEEVVRLEGQLAQAADGRPAYQFTDFAPNAQVVFYRIRTKTVDGAHHLSATIKIGLGERLDEAADVPDSPLAGLTLHGNFPNPFNQRTTVGYEVEEAQQVRIEVWDLSGQPVATLLDRVEEAGYHEVSFDASTLPSGTYFLRVQTERGVVAHPMTLMK